MKVFANLFLGIMLASHCHGNYLTQFFDDMTNQNLVQAKIVGKFEEFIEAGKLEIICDTDPVGEEVTSPPTVTTTTLRKDQIMVYNPDAYCNFVFKKDQGVTFNDVVFLSQGLTQLGMFSQSTNSKYHRITIETQGAKPLLVWVQIENNESKRRQVVVHMKDRKEYGETPSYEDIFNCIAKELGSTTTVC